MIDFFHRQLGDAVVERRAAHLPGVAFTIVAIIGCTLAYIVLAMILVPSNEPREYHFVNEDGAATALSAVFLAAASAFSLASMVTLLRVKRPRKWVWLVLALGFAFLSFDELLQFHERVGHLVERSRSSGLFRSWNDIIVLLYGVVALPILVALLPALLRWRMVLEMFMIAFLFYGIHTLVDSINEPPTSTSIIVEESAKLLCGAFLMIGTLFGFIGLLWNHVAFDPDQCDS